MKAPGCIWGENKGERGDINLGLFLTFARNSSPGEMDPCTDCDGRSARHRPGTSSSEGKHQCGTLNRGTALVRIGRGTAEGGVLQRPLEFPTEPMAQLSRALDASVVVRGTILNLGEKNEELGKDCIPSDLANHR